MKTEVGLKLVLTLLLSVAVFSIYSTAESAGKSEQEQWEKWQQWLTTIEQSYMSEVSELMNQAEEIIEEAVQKIKDAQKENNLSLADQLNHEAQERLTAIKMKLETIDEPKEVKNYHTYLFEYIECLKLRLNELLLNDAELDLANRLKIRKLQLKCLLETRRLYIQHDAPRDVISFVDDCIAECRKTIRELK